MAAGDVSVSMTSQAFRPTPFNDSTVSGGVTIEDGAMVFNGVDGRISLGDVAPFRFDVSNPFTLSTWINSTSVTTAQFIFNKQLNSGDFTGYFLSVSNTGSGGRLRVSLRDDGTKQIDLQTTENVLKNNTLHYVVMTYNGNSSASGIEVYIDGVKQSKVITADTSPLDITTTGTALQIGSRSTNVNPFNGSIYTSQIFNRSLSQAEISQIYNAGKDAYSPVTTGLVAQYSGRDYTGTAAAPKRIQDTATFNRSTARTFQTIMETFRKNTNANSKFVFDEVNNGVMLAHIEEAA